VGGGGGERPAAGAPPGGGGGGGGAGPAGGGGGGGGGGLGFRVAGWEIRWPEKRSGWAVGGAAGGEVITGRGGDGCNNT
jgi:hypothetical protein